MNKETKTHHTESPDKDFPFGPEGNKPLDAGGFDFNRKSLNEVFNSFDLKSLTPEELRNERNTRIIGIVSLVSLLLLAFLPNMFFSGISTGIFVVTGIIWLFRKKYIFFYREHKSIKNNEKRI